ncbi:hypothetical protein H9P43_001713 [Blastocladiella emersonii ATCC 22665]|nr:hypothetical protein H9P43_001713 [Blastocladiella emersonii ATCC 22665]
MVQLMPLLGSPLPAPPAAAMDGSCPAPHSDAGLVFSTLLLAGIVISYVPQQAKIVLRKSSEGLSPWFLLLGAIATISTVANVLLLQFGVLACCSVWSPLACFENSLGLIQVAAQAVMFLVILALYMAYFPTHLKACDASEVAPLLTEDPDVVEVLPPATKANLWRVSRAVAATVLVYLVAVIAGVAGLLYWTVQTSRPTPTQPPTPGSDPFAPSALLTAVAGGLGAIATVMSCCQFLPQIAATYAAKTPGALSIGTMAMQTPGTLLLIYSLASRPGTNLSTYLSYVVSATCQGTLLALAVFYTWRARRSAAAVGDSGESGRRRLFTYGDLAVQDEEDGVPSLHHRSGSIDATGTALPAGANDEDEPLLEETVVVGGSAAAPATTSIASGATTAVAAPPSSTHFAIPSHGQPGMASPPQSPLGSTVAVRSLYLGGDAKSVTSAYGGGVGSTVLGSEDMADGVVPPIPPLPEVAADLIQIDTTPTTAAPAEEVVQLEQQHMAGPTPIPPVVLSSLLNGLFGADVAAPAPAPAPAQLEEPKEPAAAAIVPTADLAPAEDVPAPAALSIDTAVPAHRPPLSPIGEVAEPSSSSGSTVADGAESPAPASPVSPSTFLGREAEEDDAAAIAEATRLPESEADAASIRPSLSAATLADEGEEEVEETAVGIPTIEITPPTPAVEVDIDAAASASGPVVAPVEPAIAEEEEDATPVVVEPVPAPPTEEPAALADPVEPQTTIEMAVVTAAVEPSFDAGIMFAPSVTATETETEAESEEVDDAAAAEVIERVEPTAAESVSEDDAFTAAPADAEAEPQLAPEPAAAAPEADDDAVPPTVEVESTTTNIDAVPRRDAAAEYLVRASSPVEDLPAEDFASMAAAVEVEFAPSTATLSSLTESGDGDGDGDDNEAEDTSASTPAPAAAKKQAPGGKKKAGKTGSQRSKKGKNRPKW